jgi:hypothetical protein
MTWTLPYVPSLCESKFARSSSDLAETGEDAKGWSSHFSPPLSHASQERAANSDGEEVWAEVMAPPGSCVVS